jgi:hypothetical protein
MAEQGGILVRKKDGSYSESAPSTVMRRQKTMPDQVKPPHVVLATSREWLAGSRYAGSDLRLATYNDPLATYNDPLLTIHLPLAALREIGVSAPD